jgi:hypothetical protein
MGGHRKAKKSTPNTKARARQQLNDTEWLNLQNTINVMDDESYFTVTGVATAKLLRVWRLTSLRIRNCTLEDKRRGGEKERICIKFSLCHHLFFCPRVYISKHLLVLHKLFQKHHQKAKLVFFLDLESAQHSTDLLAWLAKNWIRLKEN